jgi:hypothetical protein
MSAASHRDKSNVILRSRGAVDRSAVAALSPRSRSRSGASRRSSSSVQHIDVLMGRARSMGIYPPVELPADHVILPRIPAVAEGHIQEIMSRADPRFQTIQCIAHAGFSPSNYDPPPDHCLMCQTRRHIHEGRHVDTGPSLLYCALCEDWWRMHTTGMLCACCQVMHHAENLMWVEGGGTAIENQLWIDDHQWGQGWYCHYCNDDLTDRFIEKLACDDQVRKARCAAE